MINKAEQAARDAKRLTFHIHGAEEPGSVLIWILPLLVVGLLSFFAVFGAWYKVHPVENGVVLKNIVRTKSVFVSNIYPQLHTFPVIDAAKWARYCIIAADGFAFAKEALSNDAGGEKV